VRPFVLLIDDDERFRTSIASAFALRDISLDVAEDWQAGLALFQAYSHELVIADYNLPDSRNGLMLLAEAKAHRPASQLILISGVLSERASEILRGSTLVDAYLPKTADLAENLFTAAEEAVARGAEPTDWRRSAQALLASKELDLGEIDSIDEALRAEMGG
jgi:two-component system, response regulator RegA